MKVVIEVDTENSSFEDESFLAELKNVLMRAAEKADAQRYREPCLCDALESLDKLLDSNGNTVGFVRLEECSG